MNRRICSLAGLGLLALIGCSNGASSGGARAATHTSSHPVTRVQAKSDTKRDTPGKAPEYHDESESERVFIENAERAIGQYSEFLARAGDGQEYAAAAKRSREQIEDLRAAIDFVRAGAAARATH